jgi:hypothetical protein
MCVAMMNIEIYEHDAVDDQTFGEWYEYLMIRLLLVYYHRSERDWLKMSDAVERFYSI